MDCKKISFILIISCVFTITDIFAQEVNPNGLNTFYYPNGKVSSQGTMLNGKPNGYWKTFYENGNIKSAGVVPSHSACSSGQ